MRGRIIFFVIIASLLLANLDSVSAQSCLDIKLPKDTFLIGETFQAEIKITNPIEEISLESIEFFSGGRKATFPVRILKVSDELFYVYLSISRARDGEHIMRIRTFCKEGDVIIGVEESKNFRIEKERVGTGYRKLSAEVGVVWGDIEENAFAILALKDFDPDLTESGVDRLKRKIKADECWPITGCRVKETSLSLLALNAFGDPTPKVENWLLDAQNSLSIGNWDLYLTTTGDGSCELDINNQSETLTVENGRVVRSITFGSDERYVVSVTCNLTLTEAKVTHTYLGKVVDFSLEERSGVYRRELNNEKCWGTSYRSRCDFEATAFSYYALKEAGINVEGIEWLEENREDVLTLHQLFLNLLRGDQYFTDWLINNQALEGYWKNTSLAGRGEIDAFLTAFSIFTLRDKEDDEVISAVLRGREWILDRILTIGRKDLAASLYFALPTEEIKDIISVSPGAVKARFDGSFELLIENKGSRDVNLTISYLGSVKDIEIKKGSLRRPVFNVTSEENSLLTISYSGLYNIPVFVTKFIEGKDVIENLSLPFPQMKFSGEVNETILDNKVKTLRVKLVNSNPQPLENVFLTLSSELYRVVRVEPSKVDLPANSETEILIIINEGKEAPVGEYEGVIKARNSIVAVLPVRVEILASGERKMGETCLNIDFQCCELAAEDALLRPDLDETCSDDLTLTCANQCQVEEEEERAGLGIIVWMILVIITISIILIILLRARAKTKPKQFKDVVAGIEQKWKGKFSADGVKK